VRAIADRLAKEFSATNAGWSARVAPTKEAIAGSDTWVILSLLALVVGFVLLIACANVTNLALARMSGRRRELAVRTALGASRWRRLRLLLVEGLLLGLAGGALGLAVGEAGLRVIRAAAYEPIFELIRVDRNVLLFAAGVSILCPILFSLLTFLLTADRQLGDALKEGGRTSGALRARRSRPALVVAQVALAMTLLVVATLFVRSMVAINRLDMGFDPHPLLTARIVTPEWKHKDDAAIAGVQNDVLDRLRRLPGVQRTASINENKREPRRHEAHGESRMATGTEAVARRQQARSLRALRVSVVILLLFSAAPVCPWQVAAVDSAQTPLTKYASP
jgi:hypothetical protein